MINFETLVTVNLVIKSSINALFCTKPFQFIQKFLPSPKTMANVLSKKFLLSFLLICLVLSPPQARAVITCDTVFNDLKPCLNYVLVGGNVPAECCNGLKSLIVKAITTADRQSICSCLKSLATTATDEQVDRAASLPGKCGVKVPFKISRDVDCTKVK